MIVGVFLFTLAFAVRVLTRMDDTVKQLDLLVAGTLGIFSVMVFLFLIDYAARLLRPVSLVQRVGEIGMRVIQSVYPDPTTRPGPDRVARPARRARPGRAAQGHVRAWCSPSTSPAWWRWPARPTGCIEFVPQVGDFLAVDEPLFRLHGGAGAIDDRRLRASVALGTERTMEQDPTFALRILVDIAIKALVGGDQRPDHGGDGDRPAAPAAARGRPAPPAQRGAPRRRPATLRLVFLTPKWEDYVHLTCTEIRHCGGGSVQVMRRMRSMLENLLQSLPPHRHAELRRQLDLLDRTVEASFAFAEDRALARIPDPQGLGGALGLQPLKQEGCRAGPR